METTALRQLPPSRCVCWLSLLLLNVSWVGALCYSINSTKNTDGGEESSGKEVAKELPITDSTDPHSSGLIGRCLALQQTGAPHLTNRPGAGATVQVVWDAKARGWVLQANRANLAPASWVDVAHAPTVSGAEQFHQFLSGSGLVFYRLRKL